MIENAIRALGIWCCQDSEWDTRNYCDDNGTRLDGMNHLDKEDEILDEKQAFMMRYQCYVCGRKRDEFQLYMCGQCKVERYCGRKCQKIRWKRGHANSCPIIKRLDGN